MKLLDMDIESCVSHTQHWLFINDNWNEKSMNANKHSMSDYAFVNDSDYETPNDMENDSEDDEEGKGPNVKKHKIKRHR